MMSDTPTRPTPPSLPTANQVPAELLSLKQWVGWRAKWDESKQGWKKPPASPIDGSGIGAVEKYREHFTTFEEALAGAQRWGLDGVGFIFTETDPYVGIDIDNCRKDGVIHPVVADWLKWFPGAHVSISPSGTGIHIIGKGKLAKAVTAVELPNSNGATVEMYSHSRYFTFTGEVISGGTR